MDAHKTLRPHLMLKGCMDEVLSVRLKLRWLLKCIKLLECQEHRNEAGGEVYIASKGIEPLEKNVSESTPGRTVRKAVSDSLVLLLFQTPN